MKLFTNVPVKVQAENQIDYHSNLLGLGSCFVENIGAKLDYFKFPTLLNPIGILFNPVSIENLIVRAISNKTYTTEEVFEQNEQFHCFDAHSDLNSFSSEEMASNLNSALVETAKTLKKASHLIITLGTAWVYFNIENQKVVANCHKVPQARFNKKLLSIDEIVNSLKKIEKNIKEINPNITIIYTVSPVRHIKDGFLENSLSKAHLISAVHSVLKNNNQSHYFPAYEIMMDELRDYRFYGKDLVHPNDTAIEIIWDRFKESWISKDAQKTMSDVATIQRGLSHRPFNAESSAHRQFLQKLETIKNQIKSEFPNLHF
ncbi:GSCFA family protein [Flavobacteriaceae bacterium MAR_2010_188]|nr:GSCFA family protein [Flavobacteriaceae bacterium MAR_2010_188]